MAKKKAQGAVEYLFLIGGVLLVVLVIILYFRGSLFPQSSNRTITESNKYFDYIKCISGNLLKNPSFEDVLDNGQPRYWIARSSNDPAVDKVTAGDYYSGERSVLLSDSDPNARKWFYQNVSVTPQTGYVFNAYWKGTGGCGYLKIGEEHVGGAVTWSYDTLLSATASTDWKQRTVGITTASDAVALEIYVDREDSGCTNDATPLFFDSACLYKEG